MATTLLEAFQTMVSRLRITGAGPSTVVDQLDEYDVVLQALLQAHTEIVSSHVDWDFLWSQSTVTVNVGSNPNTPAASDVGKYDVKTFYYDGNPLEFVPWTKYKKQKLNSDEQAITGDPEQFTILPNKQVLAIPYPSASKQIDFDYWAKASSPAADDDELQIPDDGLEALYSRTKMIWLGDEEGPNYGIAQMEFEIAYDALEDAYWPNKGNSSMAEDQEIVVVPE